MEQEGGSIRYIHLYLQDVMFVLVKHHKVFKGSGLLILSTLQMLKISF